jgi:hypothetical protein
MFAFCNAAVAKALLVAAGFLTGGICPPAIDAVCPGPVVAIVVPAPPDTVRAPRPPKSPKAPEAPVTIRITNEGIHVDGEGALKIRVDADNLDEMTRKINRDVMKQLEGLPESLAALLGDEYDAKRFFHVKGSDIVQVARDVTIGENELVNGNVVAIASDIRIDGKVTGDVAAIFGSVELGPDAIVNGEVVSIFGSVKREDGSIVRGETAVIGGYHRRGLSYPIGVLGESVVGGIAKIAAFLIGILLMLILLFFIPVRMRATADYAAGAVLKSLGMGLLFFFGGFVLVIILGVILAITIVGIPVAVLLALSFAALLGIGYSASALALGSFVFRKFGIEGDSIYLHAIAGLFMLAILGIIASFMSMSPIFGLARGVLRTVGGLAQFAALLAGTGAFILSRAGGRGREIVSPGAGGAAER